jgi:putative acetyltransferase
VLRWASLRWPSHPPVQRQDIGSLLVKAGLEHCKEASVEWVVVLGDPNYYHRFGFISAEQYGLSCEFDAPKEAFMAIELQGSAPQSCAGVVRYQPEFNEI